MRNDSLVNRRLLTIQAFVVFVFVFLVSELIAGPLPGAYFSSKMRYLDLTPSLAVLPDPSCKLTIDDVARDERSEIFRSLAAEGNSLGFTKAAYWVRFSLEIEPPFDQSLLLQLDSPLTDNVTLYIPDGQGGFSRKVTGESYPFAQREFDFRTYLFSLPNHSGDTRTYYMRLQTEGSLQIPLSLWTQKAFIEHLDTVNITLGIYCGVMLLLVLGAVTAYSKIGDKLFLAYALYLISSLVLQLSLSGLGFQYLWSELPEWSNRTTAASIGLAIFFGLWFSGLYLQLFDSRHYRLRVAYFLGMFCGAVSVGVGLFGSFPQAAKFSAVLGIVLPPIILYSAIVSLFAGYKPARYFLIAWCIFLGGVFVSGLLYFGLVPHTFVTSYAMPIGSVFEILLLGYALMDKIALLHAEKEQAKQHAKQCLIQMNEELESLVSERTKKLQEINEKLRELASHDCKTGLLNYSAILNYLNLMQKAAKRNDTDLAVIMIDIDHFKGVNDTYGHLAGDIVINCIADLLKTSTRDSDACGRYGGEEFILLLPQLDLDSVIKLSERVRRQIQHLKIAEINGSPVTASFGIAMFDPREPNENLVARADHALYRAKGTGRNRVVYSSHSTHESLLPEMLDS